MGFRHLAMGLPSQRGNLHPIPTHGNPAGQSARSQAALGGKSAAT